VKNSIKIDKKLFALCICVVAVSIVSVLLISTFTPAGAAVQTTQTTDNEEEQNIQFIEVPIDDPMYDNIYPPQDRPLREGIGCIILYPAEDSVMIPIGGNPDNGFIPNKLISHPVS
jgi:hypothetical protein